MSGVQQPGLDVTGASAGDNIGSVQLEVGPSSTGPWSQVYFGPDTTEAVPVNGLKTGEDYYVAVTYWSLKGVPSAKLVKGPYTAPGLVSDTFVNAGALAVLDEANTAQITPNAVTSQASAETSGAQTLTGTSPKTIQTVTLTATGEAVEVRGNFYLTVWHPTAGGIDAEVRVTRDGLGDIFNQTITAINGDLIQGWQTPIVIDTPAAGSVTYRIFVTLSNNGAATQEVQATYLSAREFKR